MNYSFLRAIKFAFQDFGRNIWLSLVTISVLILAIFSVNILVSLDAVSKAVINSVENKVDISLYFKTMAAKAKVDNFRQKINSLPEVKETFFIAKDEALETFKEKHTDDAKIMEAVTQLEKNPLMDAFIIRAKSLEDYNRILAVISLSENQELIKFQNFTDHQKIIDRVMIISAKVEQVSLFLTIIFAVISILIVFNSIRLTIYTHREEIAVMKLVGANNWFVRLPFLLEGIIYAIFALVVAMIIIYALFYAIGSYLSEFLEAYNFSLLKYYNQNLLFIIGGEFLAVALLNIISSAVAVGKYLRV